MKKQFLQIALFSIALGSFAQPDYKLVRTDYVGALSSNPAEDWTQGWVEWFPKTKNYPSVTDNVTLNGSNNNPKKLEITTNLTLDPTKVYLLSGIVIVRNGASLTIPAGTIIRGESNVADDNYACLIVDRGGKIFINGEPNNPVVFTSNKPEGQREPGDWAGILLLGKARINRSSSFGTGQAQMEGFGDIASVFGNEGVFGGTDDDDNSGVIKYCRIEFAGERLAPDKELNSLTLGGIGRNTEIHHVQTSWGDDDAFEFFGGTVNAHHLVSLATADDDLDIDFGYRGIIQFAILVRDTSNYDRTWNAGGSTSEGFEIDNGGTDLTPATDPIMSNITQVGVVPQGLTHASLPKDYHRGAFRRGVRIRSNARAKLVNSIIMGNRNMIQIISARSVTESYGGATLNTDTDGEVIVRNIIFWGVSGAGASSSTNNGLAEVDGSGNLANFDTWLKLAGNNNRIDPVAWAPGNLLVNPVVNPSSGTPDFKPTATSPANTGAAFTGRIAAVTPIVDVSFTHNQAVYPNPVQRGSVIFVGSDVKKYIISNASGVELMSGSGSSQISTVNLEAGLYFINIDGKTTKLIVY